jgi:hypothetical protein
MDYEANEGFVRRWFDLRCEQCTHKWSEKLDVTTFRSGDCVAKVICPACEYQQDSDILLEWDGTDYAVVNCYDWEGENY